MTLGPSTMAAWTEPSHWRTRPAQPRGQAMQHIREEIRVEAPVEHVWEFYCDTSNWSDFYPRAEFSDFSGPVYMVGT